MKVARDVSNHLDLTEALQDFLPKYSELQLGKPIAHAAVHAKAKGYVAPRIGPVNNEPIRVWEDGLIPVAGDTT